MCVKGLLFLCSCLCLLGESSRGKKKSKKSFKPFSSYDSFSHVQCLSFLKWKLKEMSRKLLIMSLSPLYKSSFNIQSYLHIPFYYLSGKINSFLCLGGRRRSRGGADHRDTTNFCIRSISITDLFPLSLIRSSVFTPLAWSTYYIWSLFTFSKLIFGSKLSFSFI